MLAPRLYHILLSHSWHATSGGKNRVIILISFSGFSFPQYLHLKVISLVSFKSGFSFSCGSFVVITTFFTLSKGYYFGFLLRFLGFRFLFTTTLATVAFI